jgi:hypothetical protein
MPDDSPPASDGPSGRTLTLTVDRLEGDRAVLIDGVSQSDIPAAWLPAGAREGSALTLRLELAPEAEEALAERIRALQGRLGLRRDR